MKLLLSILFSAFTLLTAQDMPSINRGKALYDSICFSCHGKNLEGGIGFNLKDQEWVHGNTPAQINATIKKGFPDKGMMPFGAMYNDAQINDVTNFILSRQEGLRDLSYKVFHDVDINTPIDWNKREANKSGLSKPPYVNLNLPEVDQFAMSYKGKLIIPKHLSGPSKLVGSLKQSNGFEILIDGEKLDIKFEKRNRFTQKLNLTPGAHDFELRYIKTFRFSDIGLTLYAKEKIPLSIDSYRKSILSSHIVKAGDTFQIIRKRIKGYDSGSIAVNHRDKTTYIINPDTAEITGLWEGHSLDIGPNIIGRGQHDSKPLAASQIKLGQAISLQFNHQPSAMNYKGYSSSPSPKFMFEIDGATIEITSKFNADGLALTYSISSLQNKSISLKLPTNLKILSTDGEVNQTNFTPNKDKSSKFTILIPMTEKK